MDKLEKANKIIEFKGDCFDKERIACDVGFINECPCSGYCNSPYIESESELKRLECAKTFVINYKELTT